MPLVHRSLFGLGPEYFRWLGNRIQIQKGCEQENYLRPQAKHGEAVISCSMLHTNRICLKELRTEVNSKWFSIFFFPKYICKTMFKCMFWCDLMLTWTTLNPRFFYLFAIKFVMTNGCTLDIYIFFYFNPSLKPHRRSQTQRMSQSQSVPRTSKWLHSSAAHNYRVFPYKSYFYFYTDGFALIGYVLIYFIFFL